MKIVHICGLSAVGKNFLLKKLERTVKKDTDALQESEKYLINRFGTSGICEFPGPVSSKPAWNRELKDLENDLQDIAKKGVCNTIFHRWQFASSKAIELAGEILPDYEQKTFIIWMDPDKHKEQAITNRGEKKVYTDWNSASLKKQFAEFVKEILFYVKKSYGITDEEKFKKIKIADIPAQLPDFNIEVITSISPHLYATVDAETLRIILDREPETKS